MGGDRCELNRFAVGWSRRFTRSTSPSWIRRADGRPGARDVLAFSGETVPGAAPPGGRGSGAVRPHERGAGTGVRVALERAGSGGSGARTARQDRVLGARSPVRPAPTVVRSGGPRLPDARLTAYGCLLELLGETCRYARAGAPPRLAHGVLYAARAPRAAALPRGGESLDGGRGRRHPNRRGWMRSRVLRAAAAKHGAGVRETWQCGFRIADCGFERRASNPQSAIRNRGIDVAPPRSHRR